MRNPNHRDAKSVGVLPIDESTGTMGLVVRMEDDSRVGVYLPLEQMRSMAESVLYRLGMASQSPNSLASPSVLGSSADEGQRQ